MTTPSRLRRSAGEKVAWWSLGVTTVLVVLGLMGATAAWLRPLLTMNTSHPAEDVDVPRKAASPPEYHPRPADHR